MLRPAPEGEHAAGTGQPEDLKESAFRLAFFLCGDRATALRIATSALSRLEIAASAQDKRLYYRPARTGAVGTGKVLGFRRKVWLGEAHLLQRLVTIDSELHERERERADVVPPLSEAEAVIHFVKHLVRITLRRNSFYVALGVGRILHDYTTAQTRAAYDWLTDDNGTKNDDYFRARKAVLLRELRERFGDALRPHRGPHGDERFEAEQPPRHAALVAECLARLTPWGTRCLLPSGQAIRAGTDHEREVERMHAILHPACYSAMARSLDLPPPAERLEIPRLFFGGGDRGSDPPQERRDPPPLTRDERRALEEELERQSRRRRSSAGLLRVDVDGQRAARLDPARADRVVLQLAPGAELVEVIAEDTEDVPLAVHLLDDGPAAAPGRVAFTRTSRGRLRFSLRSDPTKGEESGRTLEVALIPPLARRVHGWLAGLSTSWRVLSPLMATLVVAMAAVFLVLRQRPATETGAAVPPRESARVAPTLPRATAPAVAPPPAVPPENAGTERAAERSPAIVPLDKVERIVFEINGDAAEIEEGLARALLEGGLRRAHDRDEADALLKGSVRPSPTGVVLTVELRDASGRIIWPVRGGPARYEGTAGGVVRRVGRDLSLTIGAARTAR